MTTWICSDIHLNHKNILKYCPERRLGQPFPEETDAEHNKKVDALVNTMNAHIIKEWNARIASSDTVIIIGDMAMGLIDKAPDLIRSMNGFKMLIGGNHDKPLMKRIRDKVPGYEDLFSVVANDYQLKYKTTDTGRKTLINLYHFPVPHWDGMNQGTLMIHGHLHGTPSGLTGRIKDVGIDTNGLVPYRLDDVVNELLSIEVIRDHHDND
jgi:calcineurin-like phosphoesterase family protein